MKLEELDVSRSVPAMEKEYDSWMDVVGQHNDAQENVDQSQKVMHELQEV